MYLSAGVHTEFNRQLTPRLQLILKGIQRNQAISHPRSLLTNNFTITHELEHIARLPCAAKETSYPPKGSLPDQDAVHNRTMQM